MKAGSSINPKHLLRRWRRVLGPGGLAWKSPLRCFWERRGGKVRSSPCWRSGRASFGESLKTQCSKALSSCHSGLWLSDPCLACFSEFLWGRTTVPRVEEPLAHHNGGTVDPKSQSSSQLYFCECHSDREAAPLPTLLLATLGFCEFRPFATFRLSCPWQHTLEPGNWSGGRQEGVVGSVMNLKGPAWPQCLQMLIKAAQNSRGWSRGQFVAPPPC